jgi:hypothetical protein
MAKRLGALFLKPTFDDNKYSTLTNNTSVQTNKHSKFNVSSASKTFTESAINEMPTMTSDFFSKIPTTTTQMSSKMDISPSKIENQPKLPVRTRLRDEINIKSHFEQHIPNYTTRKGFDLMRIVDDQVYWSLIFSSKKLHNSIVFFPSFEVSKRKAEGIRRRKQKLQGQSGLNCCQVMLLAKGIFLTFNFIFPTQCFH